MKNEGKVFEQSFQESLEKENIYVFRIKDSPSSFGEPSKGVVRFTLNNPYDFTMYKFPLYYVLELKSTQSKSISFNIWDKDEIQYVKTPMIKKHQIEGLTKASQYRGIVSGFVLNFRDNTDPKTYFLYIANFNSFLESTDKKSINQSDVVQYGGIQISQTIKRVKYKYDVKTWIANIEEEFLIK